MSQERDDLLEALQERREFLRTTLAGMTDEQAAARSTVVSACHRPTIWSPTGSPSAVKPQGTVAAGWLVRLNG